MQRIATLDRLEGEHGLEVLDTICLTGKCLELGFKGLIGYSLRKVHVLILLFLHFNLRLYCHLTKDGTRFHF